MTEEEKCRFIELCADCHPEKEMAEKRQNCNSTNCRKCGVYWAFLEGYLALDEKEG